MSDSFRIPDTPTGHAPMMIIHETKPLFAWDDLEDSPSLQTIKELFATLPDGKLLSQPGYRDRGNRLENG